MKIHLFLLFFALLVWADMAAQCTCDTTRDRLALIEFYQSTNGKDTGWADYNLDISGRTKIIWDVSQPMRTWKMARGATIGLNTEGCVNRLDLSACNVRNTPTTSTTVGAFPKSFWGLCQMEFLAFNAFLDDITGNNFRDKNDLSGKIDSNILNWKRLKHFDIRRNRDMGCWQDFPSFLLDLDSLEVVLFHLNYFKNGPTKSFNKLKNLDTLGLNSHHTFIGYHDCSPNNPQQISSFRGIVPAMENCTKLRWLNVGATDYDSLRPTIGGIRRAGNFLDLRDCKFTFDDILPYADTLKGFKYERFEYAPQQKFWRRAGFIFIYNLGRKLVMDLQIDGAISNDNYRNNTYRWYKYRDRNLSTSSDLVATTSRSQLIIPVALRCDIGDYYCEVTNPLLPLLTLKSEDFRIEVDDAPQIDSLPNQIRCANEVYSFPISKKKVMGVGEHRDTFFDSRCNEPYAIQIVNIELPQPPVLHDTTLFFEYPELRIDFTKIAKIDTFPNWIVYIVRDVDKGRLRRNSDSSFSYLLPLDNTDPVSFQYRICHCSDTTACRTATLTIDLSNSIPVDTTPTHLVLTLNDDGLNDFFIVPEAWKQNKKAQLSIFDRNGHLMFQEVNYRRESPWAGQKQTGEPLPDGTYAYRLVIDKNKPKYGTVTLFR